jgi:hypothetical protein
MKKKKRLLCGFYCFSMFLYFFMQLIGTYIFIYLHDDVGMMSKINIWIWDYTHNYLRNDSNFAFESSWYVKISQRQEN